MFLLRMAQSPAVSVQNVSTERACSQLNPPSMVLVPNESFLTYQPNADALRKLVVGPPCSAGQTACPMRHDQRLESNFGIEEKIISGHHAPYFDTAKTFAEELRPYLRAVI